MRDDFPDLFETTMNIEAGFRRRCVVMRVGMAMLMIVWVSMMTVIVRVRGQMIGVGGLVSNALDEDIDFGRSDSTTLKASGDEAGLETQVAGDGL